MQYRTLGRTGIKVSPYCLGAMMFVHGPMGEDPNQQGNSRRWIMQAVEASLRRLQNRRYRSLSDPPALARDRQRGDAFGPHGSDAGRQDPRSTEREVLPLCQTYGMGALVWSPLAKGMLPGRYRRGQPLPDSLRAKTFPKQMTDDRNLDAVERLIPIAEAAGLSLTHMGIAFVVAHPGVTSAILGPRTMQQLDDLLAGTDAGPMGRGLCAAGPDPGKPAAPSGSGTRRRLDWRGHQFYSDAGIQRTAAKDIAQP